MEWTEQGIVLNVRTHGEASAIAEVLSERRGRWSGLVRGGRSRAMRPVLQPGNVVVARWRARTEDHLGSFTLEPVVLRAGALIDDPLRLAGLMSLMALLKLLPEREPHPRIHDALLVTLDALGDNGIWPAVLVRFELGLLDELGYGLDLARCAVTGATDELIYVSPKTGRAVSRAAGEPWKERLLPLPGFLRGDRDAPPTAADIRDGLRLSGFFLDRFLLGPRGLALPDSRARILAHLEAAAIG
ncbi:MAG TPA: DNA repair protein RecO [Aestuariivirgaceae bacterium]|jgi:DNA repair protein RecO (recombination protein O)|nr:DNA repair protein RecO [Aestuariivirgaceae bacterium]